MAVSPGDRVGLGWRGALAAGILANLRHIDVLEVIADDHYRASAAELRALRRLAAQVPLSLHSVGMGLASTIPVETPRLERMLRLMRAVGADSWSEHLSFVRAPGVEIGHLAAPPRTPQSVAGSIANIRRACAVIGSAPAMENIATLIAPPASLMDEPQWVEAIVEGAAVPLLLDLHNLYANAVNFGKDPAAQLLRMPLHRVVAVHLSGGHWIDEPGNAQPPRRRLLDDHVHDVPPPVFALLTLLASHAPQPLTVIIERDGKFPPFAHLLDQLAQARAALSLGRAA
ncbi:DUF692 domain-containing protein [Janthinobacterium fluminis]|uniref:DUF692 family protein n=1 Tax=Janthinobacterium fluminis TaxID=2987524 RepID=A0ABT5K7G2_9BURK|nr:DUF692 family multinuclear iron-containing protein [Janthinobacterium fluminis]MDC8760375.1 DUF692 family protein [Janthinobacterium fluminis]